MTGAARTSAADFDAALLAAMDEAARAGDCEAALGRITRLAHDHLGDRAAGARPGALKPGERDYRVAGVFLITPDRAYNMLIANVNFPPEQRRLMIPLTWNHPGQVVATGKSILIANTDEEQGRFQQFLKSSRMGSSIYAPMRVGKTLIGQIVAAAQARGTYAESDLKRLEKLAVCAALTFHAHRGTDWLTQDYPAPDAWRAEQHVQGEPIR